jgi:hypothetical protein
MGLMGYSCHYSIYNIFFCAINKNYDPYEPYLPNQAATYCGLKQYRSPRRLDLSILRLKEDMGDLGINRRSWLNIDYLRTSPFEEHGLRVIELAIVDPNLMILVANHMEAELSI